MKAKGSEVASLKNRLKLYRENEREIDNQIERFENLTAKMYAVGSIEITDMPKAPSPAGDRLASLIGQKVELEKEIRDLISHQENERNWIRDVLKGIKSPDERAVIEMRYIDVESWTTVTKMLFGENEDFEDRFESYRRRTTQLHGSALVKMCSIISHNRP